MSGDPITYFDRYEQVLKQEAVYGEASLRFAYETVPGRFLGWLFFSRPLFSRLFGWYMSRPASAARIRPFIEQYGLDASEFAQPVEGYRSFNDFFHRELRAGARPVDPDPEAVVFPADGRHMGWQELGSEQSVFVKGQRWNLEQLLGGDTRLAERFHRGSLVLSRLCPVDYHHFHFPVSGRLRESRWMDSRLYSVNPFALRRRLAYLWENKRCLNLIETVHAGLVCFIEIGATNVGTIRHHPVEAGAEVEKGADKGWFEFGGSSIITLFEPGRIRLADDLLDQAGRGIELYARVGDRMGSCT